MMDNHLYNLMLQLTQEQKSLWRMKKEYRKDSEDCGDCSDIWNKLAAAKEEQVEMIQKHLKEHM